LKCFSESINQTGQQIDSDRLLSRNISLKPE
jgi:hypothetical protein